MRGFLTIITFLVLISNQLFGQDIQKYQYFINKAELEITELNFGKALAFYDSAFFSIKFPFSVDIYNKSICSIKQGEYAESFLSIKQLIKLGVDSSLFNKRPFNLLKLQKGMFANFMKDYPDLVNEYKATKKQSVIKELNDMVEADLFLYCAKPAKPQIFGYIEFIKINKNYLDYKLIDLFNENGGYLDESNIGVPFKDSKMATVPIFFPLIARSFNNNDTTLTFNIYIALKNGMIKPEVFEIFMEDRIEGGLGRGNGVIVYKNKIYIPKIYSKEKMYVKNRSNYFLCSLQDQVRKTLFSECKDKDGFLFYTGISRYSSMNELAEKFLNLQYFKTSLKLKQK